MSRHAFHTAAELPRSTSQPASELATSYRFPLMCGIGLLAAATAWLHAFYTVPNHDNLFMLLGAQRFLHGGRFYYDVFDPNLPLIFILLEPVVILANLTHLNTYTVFSASVSLLIIWSALEVARPTLYLFGTRRAAGTAAVLIYTAILCFLPGYQFGQREHLSIILMCPWLFGFALHDNNDSELPNFASATTIAVAAIGCLIKPYFVLLPVGMLTARAIRQRDWRVFIGRDAIIFSIISTLYLFTVILLFPEWFAVARLHVDCYPFLSRPMPVVLVAFWPPLALVMAGWVIWELVRLADPLRTFLRYLALATILLFLSAVMQHKDWDYHNLPALTLMPVILALLALGIWPSLAQGHRVSKIAALVLTMTLLFQGVIVMLPWFRSNFRSRTAFLAQPFPQISAELARGRPFLAITTMGLDVVFPTVALTNERWSSRTAAQGLVPEIVELSFGNAAQRRRAAELRQLWTRQVAEDLDRYRPVAVAVRTADDHSAFEMKSGFDLLQLLSQDEDFRRAWAPYHRARVIKDWTFYTRDRR